METNTSRYTSCTCNSINTANSMQAAYTIVCIKNPFKTWKPESSEVILLLAVLENWFFYCVSHSAAPFMLFMCMVSNCVWVCVFRAIYFSLVFLRFLFCFARETINSAIDIDAIRNSSIERKSLTGVPREPCIYTSSLNGLNGRICSWRN